MKVNDVRGNCRTGIRKEVEQCGLGKAGNTMQMNLGEKVTCKKKYG
jgi:hypothetical protein